MKIEFNSGSIAPMATRQAGLERLNKFVASRRAGKRYERERNEDRGNHQNVSCLSPFIRSRLILETEVLAKVLEHESAQSAEKFIQEVCWRTYWKGWLENRPQVWSRYCRERDNCLNQTTWARKAFERALEGRTGIDCFDAWATELGQTGYLHNHARMWFASIWIFTLNLPWQLGADFFMRHLLDADPASNTLSWRWVAGLQTVGKHYVARADNIARYTLNRFNPKGQLNEAPDPVIEPSQEPFNVPAPALTVTSSGPRRKAQSTAPTSSLVLLVHDDDLSLETHPQIRQLKELDQIQGLILLRTGQYRSDQPLGELPQQFIAQSFSDAELRLCEWMGLSKSQVIHCAEPMQMAAMLEGQESFKEMELLLAQPTIGPNHDAITPALDRLRLQGRKIHIISRAWDRYAWPFAHKGFFQFKTQIPQLLETALAA